MSRVTVLAISAIALAACGGGPTSSETDCPKATSCVGVTRTTRVGGTPEGRQVVEPRAGMTDVHAIRFESATPSVDGRSLAARFTGGVAPCFVLDRVDVDERPDKVVVTLFAGSEPASEPVACIAIAALYQTDVRLASPLAGRSIVDGAK